MNSKPCRVFLNPPADFAPEVEVAGCFLTCREQFLLLKRHREPPQGETWGIPSGKLEKLETAFQAVIREVEEEISLQLKNEEIKEIRTFYVQHPDLEFLYHLFHVKRATKPIIKLNKEEHTESHWATLEEALAMPLIGGSEDILRYCFSLTMKFP